MQVLNDTQQCFLQINSIFISSTIEDLSEYRKLLIELLPRKRCIPVCQEYFIPGPKPDIATIGHYMSQCDAVILIAGYRYGSQTEWGPSFVEIEYNYANSLKIPIVPLFFKGDLSYDQIKEVYKDFDRQFEFHNRLSKEHCYQSFNNHQEFERKANDAIIYIQEISKNNSAFVNSVYAQNEIRKKEIEIKKKDKQIANLISHREKLCNLTLLKFEIMDATFCTNQYSSLVKEDAKMVLKNILNEEVTLSKLISNIITDCVDRPILIDIATKKLSNFKKELNGITDQKKGYIPKDIDELNIVIDNLFSNTLKKLQATAIQFDLQKADLDVQNALLAAQAYWSDNEFGKCKCY